MDEPSRRQTRLPEETLEFLRHHLERAPRGESWLGRMPIHGPRLASLGIVVAITVLAALAANVYFWKDLAHPEQLRQREGPLNLATTPAPGAVQQNPRHESAPARSTAGGARNNLPTPVNLRLTAARNDSWVQIRAGSSTGRVLFEGTIRKGESVRVRAQRFWARFGSFANFDVSINGRPIHPALNGTVDALITTSAIRAVPAQAPSG